ncbi:MAG: hypothetical protein AB1814_18125 [Thermodesulfobacteriota bacterium]
MAGQGLTGASVEIDRGGYALAAEARWVGADLLVCIWGGEAPHIGAVAMATPRPSLADPQATSATASVFTYVGHKEDRLAQEAAEALAAALNCRAVVTAGCHWDSLDAQGISQVKQISRELVDQLRQRLLQQREK